MLHSCNSRHVNLWPSSENGNLSKICMLKATKIEENHTRCFCMSILNLHNKRRFSGWHTISLLKKLYTLNIQLMQGQCKSYWCDESAVITYTYENQQIKYISNQVHSPDVSPGTSYFSGTSGKIHKYRCMVGEPSPATNKL